MERDFKNAVHMHDVEKVETGTLGAVGGRGCRGGGVGIMV